MSALDILQNLKSLFVSGSDQKQYEILIGHQLALEELTSGAGAYGGVYTPTVESSSNIDGDPNLVTASYTYVPIGGSATYGIVTVSVQYLPTILTDGPLQLTISTPPDLPVAAAGAVANALVVIAGVGKFGALVANAGTSTLTFVTLVGIGDGGESTPLAGLVQYVTGVAP